MAIGEVTTECPNCGQRLRSGWLRCPRCRQLAPDAPASSASATAAEDIPPARSGGVWLGAGAAAIIVALIAVTVMSSGLGRTSAETTGATSSAARVIHPSAIAAGEPRSVDSAERAHHQSEDERRAGMAAYSAGDINSAVDRFQAAVDAKPDDADARNDLAQVLVRQGRPADAVPHLDEAIRLDPQKWAYHFNRARAYSALEQLPQAIADYRGAADLFPDDYATHYNLGLVYLRTKQYTDAIESLERAVSLAPGDSTFLISLGTAYVGAAQPDKAKASFEKFLEVAADDDPEVGRVKALIQALDAAKEGA